MSSPSPERWSHEEYEDWKVLRDVLEERDREWNEDPTDDEDDD